MKKFVPLFLKKWLKNIQTKKRIKELTQIQKNKQQELQGKEKIKVAFYVFLASIWKYDHLYKLLQNEERYEPVIFILPFTTYGEETQKEEMQRTYDHFVEKGYEVRKTNLPNGEWLDIKTSFAPDLIFYTNPWEHSLVQYSILNNLEALTCYVPYGFNSCNLYDVHYNKPMQNYCWKYFVETNFHKDLAQKYSLRKGENVIVTGYPGIDNFRASDYVPHYEGWKSAAGEKKRIVWAPHHTIPGFDKILDYSTFLTYADFMWEISQEYKSKIEICFKPHPNLKSKLYELKEWGKQKTDAYFTQWEEGENTHLNEGDYTDLFLTSDTLIHDSGSFVLEYFFLDKPVQFLVNNQNAMEQFNDLGKKALQSIHLGYSKEDILSFINNVVIENKDDFVSIRREFKEKYLSLANEELASQKIFNDLNESF